ncbi:MAG: CvpA family protein [Clostridia bacterium]|nr:CvpA family protein [Clostridia bacterium]
MGAEVSGGFQMAYIADIVVVLYLLIMAVVNAKKGFVGCVFGLVGSIVALAVAFLCAEMVVEATDNLFGLQALIENAIMPNVQGATVQEALANMNIPEFLIGIIAEGQTDVVAGIQELSHFLTLVVAGVVLFILCKIVLKILEKIFRSLIEHISFINAIDKLLGAVIGLAQGALTVLLILAAVTMIPEAATSVGGLLDQTLFLGVLYHENPILQIFSMIFAS